MSDWLPDFTVWSTWYFIIFYAVFTMYSCPFFKLRQQLRRAVYNSFDWTVNVAPWFVRESGVVCLCLAIDKAVPPEGVEKEMIEQMLEDAGMMEDEEVAKLHRDRLATATAEDLHAFWVQAVRRMVTYYRAFVLGYFAFTGIFLTGQYYLGLPLLAIPYSAQRIRACGAPPTYEPKGDRDGALIEAGLGA